MNFVRLGVLGALAIVGCAPVVRFTPTGDVPARQAKSGDQVKLFFDLDEPKCKYRVVGVLEAQRPLANNAAAMQVEPLREEAAKRGFDGVAAIKCAPPGTVGSEYGTCTGRAYVCD